MGTTRLQDLLFGINSEVCKRNDSEATKKVHIAIFELQLLAVKRDYLGKYIIAAIKTVEYCYITDLILSIWTIRIIGAAFNCVHCFDCGEGNVVTADIVA